MPNPGGLATKYNVIGNGISTGSGNADRVKVTDGIASDNNVYSIDVNHFSIFDGPR